MKLTTSFEHGYKAYLNGWSKESNPYCDNENKTHFNSWNVGWELAHEEHDDHLADLNKLYDKDWKSLSNFLDEIFGFDNFKNTNKFDTNDPTPFNKNQSNYRTIVDGNGDYFNDEPK